MKKVILKLLLASVFITSFSVHAVDIEQVLDATGNLSIEDQAEILFKTATIGAIDINKALGLNEDRSLWIVIPATIAANYFSIMAINITDLAITRFAPNSISHFKEQQKIDKITKEFNRKHRQLEMIDPRQTNETEAILKQRDEIQKRLDIAKHDLRSMRAQRGFFRTVGRVVWRVKKVTFGLGVIGVSVAIGWNGAYVIFNSEEDMIRLQKKYEHDIELLIEKSNALF